MGGDEIKVILLDGKKKKKQKKDATKTKGKNLSGMQNLPKKKKSQKIEHLKIILKLEVRERKKNEEKFNTRRKDL